MWRLFAAIAAGLCLAACEETMWVKPGATPAEFNQAAYECERDTRMSAGSFGYGFMAQVAAASFAQRCMNTKGFYQQSAGARNAGPSPSRSAVARTPAEDPAAWSEVTSIDLDEIGRMCVRAVLAAPRQGGSPKVARVLKHNLAVARYVELGPLPGRRASSYMCKIDDSGEAAAVPI